MCRQNKDIYWFAFLKGNYIEYHNNENVYLLCLLSFVSRRNDDAQQWDSIPGVRARHSSVSANILYQFVYLHKTRPRYSKTYEIIVSTYHDMSHHSINTPLFNCTKMYVHSQTWANKNNQNVRWITFGYAVFMALSEITPQKIRLYWKISSCITKAKTLCKWHVNVPLYLLNCSDWYILTKRDLFVSSIILADTFVDIN